jgi:hypothetical protein
VQTPRFTRLKDANAHDLPNDLFAALVAYVQNDAIFARLTGYLVFDRAVDVERAVALFGDGLCGCTCVEPQVVPASRAHR